MCDWFKIYGTLELRPTQPTEVDLSYGPCSIS